MERKPRGYWDIYENCYNEAKKFSTRIDFSLANSSCYHSCSKHGWLDTFSWMPKRTKGNKSPRWTYTYEMCYDCAKQYTNCRDFQSNSKNEYHAAYRNGWIKDYTWFVPLLRKSYDRDSCYEEAKKYKTFTEFRKNNESCYRVAKEKGWTEDYTWLKVIHSSPHTWDDFEKCKKEALKFKSKKEFRETSPSCYDFSCKRGWLENFDWLIDERIDLYKGNIDSVYVYEFENENVAYIGRTLIRRQNARDVEHLFDVDDPVFKFAHENKISVPSMKILETDLTLKDGVNLEKYWIEKYKNDGWTLLNKNNGGSIGTLGKGKWDKDSCYNEAKLYTTLKEFAEKSASAYNASNRNGWSSEYTWLKRERKISKKSNIVWNYDLVVEESKKYKTRNDFRTGSSGAYNMARLNGWLNDFSWLDSGRKPHGYWTYERVKEDSMKYKNVNDWKNGNSSAYNKAYQNKWLDDFTWLRSNNVKSWGYWTYERCMEDSKKFTNVTDWVKNSPSSWSKSYSNGWDKDFYWIKNRRK